MDAVVVCGDSCSTSTMWLACMPAKRKMMMKKTWCDSFIIDSHVIIVRRHRVCAPLLPCIYLLNGPTDTWQTELRSTRMHIIYEHMFYSCWSLAITLTTWSREKDRHGGAKMRHDTNNAHYRMTKVMYDLDVSPSFSSLLKHCTDGIGGNLRILDKFVKFFATIFVLRQSFFALAGFNSSFQCVYPLRKVTEEMKLAIFSPALSNWAAVNTFFVRSLPFECNNPQKNNKRTRRQGTYCAIHLRRIVLVRPIMWTERMWIWWREWRRREKRIKTGSDTHTHTLLDAEMRHAK